MKSFVFYSLIFAFLFFSCCKSPTGNNKGDECKKFVEGILYPLAEGNYWARQLQSYYAGQLEPEWTDTVRIIVEEMLPVKVGGGAYLTGMIRVVYRGDIPDLTGILRWNGPQGFYTLGMVAPTDTFITEPVLEYKYPVEVGESWQVPVLVYNPYEGGIFFGDTLTYACAAEDEPFATPLDTFQTVVYHYYYHPVEDVLAYWHFFQYVAPGVGPVGTAGYSSFDSDYLYEQRQLRDLIFTYTLIDYCLH